MMEKIALLVDSCLDIPAGFREKNHIYMVPLNVVYQDRSYLDGIEITAEEVYRRLKEEIPKTSLPHGDQIIKVFDQIRKDGYNKVLAITISANISGTFNAVRLIGEQQEDMEVVTIDTKSIAIGSGLIGIQAARLIKENMPFAELCEEVRKTISKAKVFFCVATLEYLQKGGRIGLVESTLGNLLKLKPIISCNEEGVYHTVAKVRGRQQSLNKTVDLACEFLQGAKKYDIAVMHGDAVKEALEIEALLLSKLPTPNEFIRGQISPVLGVHTGPGLIGIAVQIIE